MKYGVVKVDNPKCEDYGKWRLNSYREEGHLYIPEQIIFRAKTRKACLNYANESGIVIDFYENGRSSGAKF